MSPRPDCCQQPSLHTLSIVDEITAGQIVLKRCECCRSNWLAIECRLELAEGDVDLHSLERVSAEEASELLMEPAY